MKKMVMAAMVLALTGCVTKPPPVRIRSAPVPSGQELNAWIGLQSRTLPIETSAAFPRVLTVLLNAGYLIRSANKELGQVSFYQQWRDPDQGGANITQEGTLLFTPAGPNATILRVVVSAGWQRLEVTGGSPKTPDTGMVAGVEMRVPAEEYMRLLDLIEAGLLGH